MMVSKKAVKKPHEEVLANMTVKTEFFAIKLVSDAVEHV
jgi:hypothetical protein